MAKDSSPLQNLNVGAKQAIEQTMKQTEGEMDNYFNLFFSKLCLPLLGVRRILVRS
jgi:hypothetical protein